MPKVILHGDAEGFWNMHYFCLKYV